MVLRFSIVALFLLAFWSCRKDAKEYVVNFELDVQSGNTASYEVTHSGPASTISTGMKGSRDWRSEDITGFKKGDLVRMSATPLPGQVRVKLRIFNQGSEIKSEEFSGISKLIEIETVL